MRIDKLVIQNFKCFKETEIDFGTGLNLIVGINGTGKTSLLEALSIAAGSFFLGMNEVEKRNIKKNEIRFEVNFNNPQYHTPTVIRALLDVVIAEMPIETQKYWENWLYKVGEERGAYLWERILFGPSGRTMQVEAVLLSHISRIFYKNVNEGEAVTLPIIAYYGTERLFISRKKTDKNPIGRWKGYYNALNGSSSQAHLNEWFKWAEFNEYQRKTNENPDFVDNELALFQDAIKFFLKKEKSKVSPEDVKSVYYLETEIENGLYISFNNGQTMPISRLSDGYRNLLWLVGDMAYRCATLNPFLTPDEARKIPGVVMIDEVDLHLHPRWQREVLSKLVEFFPNIQFFITTHSPIVLGSAEAHLVVLSNDQTKNEVTVETFVAPDVYGRDVRAILSEWMGVPNTRPDKIAKLIEDCGNAIDGRKYDEAIEILKELESWVGRYDSEVVSLRNLLRFLGVKLSKEKNDSDKEKRPAVSTTQ